LQQSLEIHSRAIIHWHSYIDRLTKEAKSETTQNSPQLQFYPKVLPILRIPRSSQWYQSWRSLHYSRPNSWILLQLTSPSPIFLLFHYCFYVQLKYIINESNILLICFILRYSCSFCYVKCVVLYSKWQSHYFPFLCKKGRWPSFWYAIQYTCICVTQCSDTLI
jgi:hypothetical protein